MWDNNKYGKKYLPYPVYIQDIFKNLDDEISVAVGNTTTKSWISDFDLTTVNDWLKPEYKIIHDELNESDEFDDEFEINDWGKKELRIGDTITPDIWEDTMEAGWEYPVYIKDVDKDEDGIFITIIRNDIEEIWDADELTGWMKPGYEITPF